MNGQKYLGNVVTLRLDAHKCIGCGMCTVVCPHGVFVLSEGKAAIVDRDACMECGACSRNCPVEAIAVRAGVGCATAVLSSMVSPGKQDCDCCCETSEGPC